MDRRGTRRNTYTLPEIHITAHEPDSDGYTPAATYIPRAISHGGRYNLAAIPAFGTDTVRETALERLHGTGKIIRCHQHMYVVRHYNKCMQKVHSCSAIVLKRFNKKRSIFVDLKQSPPIVSDGCNKECACIEGSYGCSHSGNCIPPRSASVREILRSWLAAWLKPCPSVFFPDCPPDDRQTPPFHNSPLTIGEIMRQLLQ